MAVEPALRARFRVEPEDFEVEEILGFEPDGGGEHLWLWVCKRGANTAWVAEQLACWAGVALMAVGYGGMKDRHAVTRQWFSVHLPRRTAPEGALDLEGVQVLAQHWHGRKLKRGSHRGNRFGILLRDLDGDRLAAERRLLQVSVEGVPNAFGAQRFGHEGGNVEAARRWLSASRPQRLSHARRGLLLSTARAHLFNAVLSQRVERGDWNRPLAGDCFQLDGRGSWFGPEAVIDDVLVDRVSRGEIHPTGPLWGEGALASALSVADLEAAVGAAEPVLAAGLARFGLRQERRSLRLRPHNLQWQWRTASGSTGDVAAAESLHLEFELPSGSFATAVVDAICDASDAASI